MKNSNNEDVKKNKSSSNSKKSSLKKVNESNNKKKENLKKVEEAKNGNNGKEKTKIKNNSKGKEIEKDKVERKENNRINFIQKIVRKFKKEDNVSKAVRQYQKYKAKKEKKKKLVEGKFTLDILDLLIIVVVTAIISCVFTGVILNIQFKKTSNLYDIDVISDKNIQDFLNTYAEILDNYYEEVDKDALMKAAMDGMLSFLEDNYSIYLDKNDSDQLEEMLDSSYEGLGIVVSGVTIHEVYDDSPASKAGFKEGDIIVEINKSAVSMENYEDISGLISLEEENTIKVLRDDKELTFKVEAGTITVPTTSKEIMKSTNNKDDIGYIKLTSFSSLSFEEFQEDLMELEDEDITSLIVDLRGNTGGYLNIAYNIASLFIEKGKVIYSLESKNNITTYKDETKDKRNYDIVVLVDSSTASAAEVLTAALKDSYGATIVGNTTYGKGKVQNIKHYEDSILKYTSAKWLRPNGECVDGVGIKPDYELNNMMEENIIYDLQLDKAIELLS